MTAIFWSGFSKRNNSTLQPSGAGTSYEVYLKDNTSILSPVFMIDGIDLSVTYCRWNGRYYFVRDIVLSNNNIYQVVCELDALASRKSEIGASEQYILRAASEYDGTIVDAFYPTKKDPEFSVKDSALTPVSWSHNLNGGCFIVGIISGQSGVSGTIAQGAVKYYCFDPGAFETFAAQLFTESNYQGFAVGDRYTFNPIQYISSIQWFPFKPGGTSFSGAFLKLGWADIPAAGLAEIMTTGIGEYTYQFAFDRHPQAAARGQYLNSAPYTDYHLVFPPFGEMTLDGNICAQSPNINVILKVDFLTGRAQLIGRSVVTLAGVAKVYEHFRREVQFGVNIQIAQISSNRLGVAQQLIGTAGNLVGSIMTGNVLGAITGTASGIISAIQTGAAKADVSGSNDSMANFLGSATFIDPHLYEVFHIIVDEDNDNHGRPLCKVRTINTLSGFIMTANAEIALSGLPAEKEMIINAMNSGFFYE